MCIFKIYTLFLVRIHVYVVDRDGIDHEDKLVLFSPGFI